MQINFTEGTGFNVQSFNSAPPGLLPSLYYVQYPYDALFTNDITLEITV